MIGRLENGGRITTRQPNEVLIKVPIRLFERVGYLFCRPLGRGVVVRHGSTVTTVPLEGGAQGKHPGREGIRRLARRAPRLGDTTAMFAIGSRFPQQPTCLLSVAFPSYGVRACRPPRLGFDGLRSRRSPRNPSASQWSVSSFLIRAESERRSARAA